MKSPRLPLPLNAVMIKSETLIQNLEDQTKGRKDLCAFIIGYERFENEMIKSINTFNVLKKQTLNFRDFTRLHISAFNRIFDRHYCNVGLKRVREGDQELLNCSFEVLYPLVLKRDIHGEVTTENCFIALRKTRLYRVDYGKRIADAIVVTLKILCPYSGQPLPYAPVFKKPSGEIFERETNLLKAEACDLMLSDKRFPINSKYEEKRERLISICEHSLDGRSRKYIQEVLEISEKELNKDIDIIKYNARKHLPKSISFQAIMEFYRQSHLL